MKKLYVINISMFCELKYCFVYCGRTIRKEFINAKYVDHKFARKTYNSAAVKLSNLYDAARSRDLLALIQVYADGVELMEPLSDGGLVSLRT